MNERSIECDCFIDSSNDHAVKNYGTARVHTEYSWTETVSRSVIELGGVRVSEGEEGVRN